jgi:hypothetical protein
MLLAKEIFSDKFRLPKIIRKKKENKKIGLPDFPEITIDGSPESLLMAFWEKKNYEFFVKLYTL